MVTLKVVGIGDHLEDRLQSVGPNANAYASEAFSRLHGTDAGHFGGPTGLRGHGLLWLEGGAAALDAFVASARSVSPDAGFGAFAQFADPLRHSTSLLASGAFLFALAAGVALLAGLAVAGNRHLARSRRDRDVLSALGASPLTIAGLAISEILPAAVLAGVLSSGLTIALARLTPFGSQARAFDPNRGALPGALVLVIGGAAVILATIALAVAGSLAPRRLRSPGRPSAPVTSRRSLAAGSPTMATGMRFAFSRGRGSRAVPVVSALVAGVLGVAGVVGGFAYAAGLKSLRADNARWGWTWSVLLDAYEDTPAQADALVAGRTDIAGWALLTAVEASVNGAYARAMSFEVLGGSLPLTLREGRLPASPDEVVLGTGMARQLGAAIGDIVHARSPQGDTALAVVGLATLYPNDSEQLSTSLMLLTPDGLGGVALSDPVRKIAVKAAPGIGADVLYARAAELLGDAMTPAAYALANPPLEISNATQLRPVPLALATFFGTLALALVGNALLTTPRRRRSELALLRALGLRPRQAGRTIRWQAFSIATVSMAVGVPLGLITEHLAFARLADDAFVEPGRVATPALVLTVIAVGTTVMYLFSLWPARRAGRLRIGEALRSE